MAGIPDSDRPSLADGWDEHAQAWVEWTRQGLDSYATHRSTFLPLIPDPGRLTIDVGAGEGRVSRELVARGHRVVAFDSSLTMARAAAAHHEVPVAATVADAGRLPLRAGAADCAVVFMCLQDMDDLSAVVHELGRVVGTGGRLVIAIVHPLSSAGDFDRTDSDIAPPFVLRDAYTEPRRYTDVRVRGGMTMTYHGIHRPLHAYTTALSDAGFGIEALREIASDDPTSRWSRVPSFLHLLAYRR